MIDFTKLQPTQPQASTQGGQPMVDPFNPTPTTTTGTQNTPQAPWMPFQRPSWFTPYTYQKTEELGPNVPWNRWWRDPSWGGHVEYHPYWGFQDLRQMQDLYAQNPNMTWQQFMQLPLTQQMSETGDWAKYFPDRVTGGGDTTGGGGWDDGFGNYQQPQNWGQDWMEGFTMPETQFPYPEQWQTASDVWTRFAEGLPTDVSQWWEAQQPVLQRTISDQAKQMAEQMGLGGLRYSTPMTYQLSDITGRETANLWAQLAQNQLGLTEAAKDRGMAAAGGLAGLGQQYLNAPQDWASRMYGMGAGMTGLGQDALGRSYQDWMRMTPEMSPWLAQAMGFAGLQNQMMPQQYQQSFLSQLLNALGMGAGMYGALK